MSDSAFKVRHKQFMHILHFFITELIKIVIPNRDYRLHFFGGQMLAMFEFWGDIPQKSWIQQRPLYRRNIIASLP